MQTVTPAIPGEPTPVPAPPGPASPVPKAQTGLLWCGTTMGLIVGTLLLLAPLLLTYLLAILSLGSCSGQFYCYSRGVERYFSPVTIIAALPLLAAIASTVTEQRWRRRLVPLYLLGGWMFVAAALFSLGSVIGPLLLLPPGLGLFAHADDARPSSFRQSALLLVTAIVSLGIVVRI